MPFAATYFDGQSAASVEGSIELSGAAVHFRSASKDIYVSTEESRLVAPVGKGSWTIEIPGGGSIRVDGEDAGERLTAIYGSGTFVRRL